MTVDDVVVRVASFHTRYVCVTGGEPLAQRDCRPLLGALCDAGYSVSLETSGSLDVGNIDPRVTKVMDLKAPGSGEGDRNRWDNLVHLGAHDEIKIVLADETDYRWAREQIRSRGLHRICDVLLSPAHGILPLNDLAEWILRDALPVRLQLQLHKIIWGASPGR